MTRNCLDETITLKRFLFLITLTIFLSGCNLPPLVATPPVPTPEEEVAAVTETHPTPETLITFRMVAPQNSPTDGLVYLSLLDEVTGLALNTQINPMEPLPPVEEGAPPAYLVTLPFPIGSVVKYRYERQVGDVRVAEHLSDGSAVRYRMYYVTGQGFVEDVVSRWTDTAYESPSGRIMGSVQDATTEKPIPNLLVTAGGAQTLSAADGSFVLEGLPPGVHNLVGYALDGSHQTFQQGARVAAESTTPAVLKLNPAQMIKVTFVLHAPDETPPVVPLRLAGNLFGLGNSFASLNGGMSSLAVNMPVMSQLPDGRYTITLSLPVGADIRYKYTLGDGFWNAEHNLDGSFRLRQLIVPKQTLLVEDTVETWRAGDTDDIIFDVTVPDDTPATDFVSLQFNPLFGWTEPIPMWKLAENRWAYILYSPRDLPGNLSYRYCRNGQCGYADDAQTPGLYGEGRPAPRGEGPQTQRDEVEAWADWSNVPESQLPEVEAQARESFARGIETLPDYHPSWRMLFPTALDDIQERQANWLVFSPTWSYGRGGAGNNPPILAQLPGNDALWPDLLEITQQAKTRGLQLAIYPQPRLAIPVEDWWSGAQRDDPGWWPVWFAEYRTFVLHHAELASQSQAEALILGGDWLSPALPGGELADGSPSGVPADAEQRWRDLIAEVRSRFGGQLIWSISNKGIESPPPFLDTVDQIYLTIRLEPGQSFSSILGMELSGWLDGVVWPAQLLADRPLALAVELPASPDLQMQVNLYHTALSAAGERDWISGFISQGYFPPAALKDASTSVHGKSASDLLQTWFKTLSGN
jgi:hypothetical protein